MLSQLTADQHTFVGTPRDPPVVNSILGMPPSAAPKTVWETRGVISGQPSVILTHGRAGHPGQSAVHFDGIKKPSGRQK